MTDLARITREHVLRAAREVAEERPDEPTPDAPHRLAHAGREHDAVEVVDRAYWLATGGDLAEDVDPPDARDCALLLRGLGFEVAGEALPPMRFTSAATVGAEHSHATWALAARERLLEVAAVYGEAISYHDLAEFVQRRSLVRTSAHPRSWIGDVLRRVAEDCASRREPFLTALVVDAQGKVGASYATALEAIRGLTPDDVDEHAAQERLECHRHFGAELPSDGGRPVVLRPAPAARRPAQRAATRTPGSGSAGSSPGSRTRTSPPRRAKVGGGRRTAEESVAAAGHAAARTCPVHFTVLPPSGLCDYCE